MTNVETVQAMYQAFSRGDVPAILSHLAENIEWEYGQPSTDVPWLQPRQGRNNVPGFFESLQALEFHRFEPTRLLADGDVVVALIDIEATVKATGTRVADEDEVHIWRFDPAGKVTRFRHRTDTHRMVMALRV